MDQILITIPEIREVRQLSKNYDTIEFNGYVSEVQRNYFEKLIGSELYLDLLNNTETLISGTLVVSEKYTITDYKSGDDFTNVGASKNENGEVFIATGTTPTNWTNESKLQTTSDIYFDLLEGKEYTYQNKKVNFRGSKIYLIYLFLYLYFKEGDINYSDSGKKTYNVENSTDARTPLNSSITSNHFTNAQNFGEDITKYLNDNSADYPLFESSETNQNVNFRFGFNVLGANYRRSRIIQ